jgi:hypothetical protein
MKFSYENWCIIFTLILAIFGVLLATLTSKYFGNMLKEGKNIPVKIDKNIFKKLFKNV